MNRRTFLRGLAVGAASVSLGMAHLRPDDICTAFNVPSELIGRGCAESDGWTVTVRAKDSEAWKFMMEEAANLERLARAVAVPPEMLYGSIFDAERERLSKRWEQHFDNRLLGPRSLEVWRII